MDEALLLARLLLAAVFAVAGAAKLADLAGSRAAVEGFGVPERLARPIGTLLPFAELATAVLLLPAATARAGGIAALGLLLVFSAGIAASIARGEAPDCNCFGQIHSEPVGPKTLGRNFALAVVAGFVVATGDDAGPGLFEAIGDLSAGAAAAVAGGIVLVALLALGLSAYLQLLRQHGRVLLRLEALEGALRARGIPIPVPAPEPEAAGLPVGSQAPEFSLPGFHGDTVTLASLRAPGRPVMLVFTDPGCGPCKAMLPRIGRWQREHADALTIALISRGDAEKMRAEAAEHEVATVLSEPKRETSSAYMADATPTAVLVARDGTIGSPPAGGETAIAALVDQTVKPLDVVRVPAAPPVQAGDPVPETPAMRDLEGNEVSLADELGKSERLIVFWNPGCGFCQRMLPDIHSLETEAPDVAATLLFVSAGEPEANREQKLPSTVMLDDGFAVGRALGATGTPSAIRVDADGRVASEIAVGADAVLALAGDRTGA